MEINHNWTGQPFLLKKYLKNIARIRLKILPVRHCTRRQKFQLVLLYFQLIKALLYIYKSIYFYLHKCTLYLNTSEGKRSDCLSSETKSTFIEFHFEIIIKVARLLHASTYNACSVTNPQRRAEFPILTELRDSGP